MCSLGSSVCLACCHNAVTFREHKSTSNTRSNAAGPRAWASRAICVQQQLFTILGTAVAVCFSRRRGHQERGYPP